MKRIIEISDKRLSEIISESIKKIVSENINKHLKFMCTCVDFEDGMEVQEITRFDEYSSNEYAIQDDYFNDGTIEIIDTEQFLNMVKGEPLPKLNTIDYCAFNNDLNIGWIYTTDDIHWFYK